MQSPQRGYRCCLVLSPQGRSSHNRDASKFLGKVYHMALCHLTMSLCPSFLKGSVVVGKPDKSVCENVTKWVK